jgi:large subunit ribosomal protein L35
VVASSQLLVLGFSSQVILPVAQRIDPHTEHQPPRDFADRLLYCSVAMPKMKTHSGAKKRFKVTAGGKVRARHSFTSHILEKKSPKRKRHLGQPVIIAKSDEKRVKTLLGAKTK